MGTQGVWVTVSGHVGVCAYVHPYPPPYTLNLALTPLGLWSSAPPQDLQACHCSLAGS